MESSESLLLSGYVALLILLSVFSLHRLALAVWAGRLFRAVASPPEGASDGSESEGAAGVESARPLARLWPTVLVQLPLYNERFVAVRAIDAACRLRYPREKLTIQVLDDSTDDTSQIVARAVQSWRDRGVSISHLRRTDRAGFKAGALAAGLSRSNACLVAIFDADFIPQPEFLRQLVPELDDPQVAMVQARWGHVNRDESPLTRAQAVLLDGHFLNEHSARYVRGCFFNFNGTCGVWRRAAIEDAGGWSGRTITEDLDLSYRAQLRGWRFIYRPDVVVPGELPDHAQAFKAQQYRWAKGSVDTAKLLLPEIWRSPDITLRTRLEATFHLAGNAAYPLVMALALLMPWVMVERAKQTGWLIWLLDAALLSGSMLSLCMFYVLAIKRAGLSVRRAWRLPAVLALGVGLAVNNTRAVVAALLGRVEPFRRTPKLGAKPSTAARAAYALRGGGQGLIEILVGLYLGGAIYATLAAGRVAAVPFLILFAAGFLWLGVASLWRARPGRIPVLIPEGARDDVATTRVDSLAAGGDNRFVAGSGRRSASAT